MSSRLRNRRGLQRLQQNATLGKSLSASRLDVSRGVRPCGFPLDPSAPAISLTMRS